MESISWLLDKNKDLMFSSMNSLGMSWIRTSGGLRDGWDARRGGGGFIEEMWLRKFWAYELFSKRMVSLCLYG